MLVQKQHYPEAAMSYDQAHSLLMLIIERTKHSEYAPYMTRLSTVGAARKRSRWCV
jgi:hypothetical protein